MNFDYFSANCSFAWNYDVKAQYCWAHLIREMRFLLKHPDKETQDWAEQLLHRDRFLEIARCVPESNEANNLAVRFAEVEVSDGSRYDMSQDYHISPRFGSSEVKRNIRTQLARLTE